jgi:3-hydroxybutyryl-CoA dehydratase
MQHNFCICEVIDHHASSANERTIMRHVERPTPLQSTSLTGHMLKFEDMALGMGGSLMRTVMASDIARFAEVSGDDNPIHLDEAYAKSTRFGQRIARGMFTASLVSALMGTRFPGPGAVYLSQTLNFLSPVKIGDVVAVSVSVIGLVLERRRVQLACEARVDARLVMDGEAWVAMPKG